MLMKNAITTVKIMLLSGVPPEPLKGSFQWPEESKLDCAQQ